VPTFSQGCAGKRIAITGGAGYLAAAIVSALGTAPAVIRRVDRSGAFFPQPDTNVRTEDLHLDVRSPETWESLLADTDIVFHLAAQTSAYASFDDPMLDLQVNQIAMLHLVETCRRSRKPVDVVFAGTVTEYGISPSLPVDESNPERPTTIYDVHKLAAEYYLKLASQRGILRGTILRLANVYGPGPRSSSGDRGILNGMARRALKGETLTIYGDGEYLRDYVYVDDVASAFVAAGSAMARVNGNHYVMGSGTGHTFRAAVEMVAARVSARTGKTVSVAHVAPPAGLLPIEARNFVANTAAFTAATTWRAQVSLEQGVELTIDAIQREAIGKS
jgi:nucleoside-diphosphate-sugar epimerase